MAPEDAAVAAAHDGSPTPQPPIFGGPTGQPAFPPALAEALGQPSSQPQTFQPGAAEHPYVPMPQGQTFLEQLQAANGLGGVLSEAEVLLAQAQPAHPIARRARGRAREVSVVVSAVVVMSLTSLLQTPMTTTRMSLQFFPMMFLTDQVRIMSWLRIRILTPQKVPTILRMALRMNMKYILSMMRMPRMMMMSTLRTSLRCPREKSPRQQSIMPSS